MFFGVSSAKDGLTWHREVFWFLTGLTYKRDMPECEQSYTAYTSMYGTFGPPGTKLYTAEKNNITKASEPQRKQKFEPTTKTKQSCISMTGTCVIRVWKVS
jgi:hypothetical protein